MIEFAIWVARRPVGSKSIPHNKAFSHTISHMVVEEKPFCLIPNRDSHLYDYLLSEELPYHRKWSSPSQWDLQSRHNLKPEVTNANMVQIKNHIHTTVKQHHARFGWAASYVARPSRICSIYA